MNYEPYKIDDSYEVFITNYNNELVDISDIVEQFNLFFDLFNPVVKLELIIQDGFGLLEDLPILGEETVTISMKSINLEVNGRSFYEKPIVLVFRVYKITDKVQVANRANLYKLHCTSQEGHNNMRYAVWKSFNDVEGKKIIQEIYDDYLKPDPEEYSIFNKFDIEFDDIKFDNKEDKYSYIFNGDKPLLAISRLIKRFRNFERGHKASNFIFYQGNDRWYLKTIDNLIDPEIKTLRDADPKSKIQDFYFLDPRIENEKGNSIFGKFIRPDQKILSFHVLRQLDNEENLDRGMFFNTTHMLDPLIKRYKKEVFLYEEDRKDLVHLENIFSAKKASVYTAESQYKTDITATECDEYMQRRTIFTQIGEEYETGFLAAVADNDIQIKNPERIVDHYKLQYVSMLKLNNMSVEISIPGNTDLEIGQLLNLNILANNLGSTNVKKGDPLSLNRLYGNKTLGGFWLITNIRHTFVLKDANFITYIQCIRDVFHNNDSVYNNPAALAIDSLAGTT